jgi:hypothetical protein
LLKTEIEKYVFRGAQNEIGVKAEVEVEKVLMLV